MVHSILMHGSFHSQTRGHVINGHIVSPKFIEVEILQRNYRIMTILWSFSYKKSEYDQDIPQSHTADQHMAPRGRATEHLQ